MTVKDGEIAEAEDVVDLMIYMFKNSMQSFFFADYVNWEDINTYSSDFHDNITLYMASPKKSNLKYLAAKTGDNYTAEVDGGNTTTYDGLDRTRVYYVATSYDEFDDAAIDATLWTTSGSVTETGGYVSIDNAGSYIKTDGTSGIDYKSLSKDSAFEFRFRLDNNGGGVWDDLGVYISDSTGDTLLYNTIGTVGSDTNCYRIRVQIDYSAETVDVFLDGTEVATAVDISANTNNWYVKIKAISSNAVTPMRILHYRHITGDGTALVYQSLATTSTPTITNAIIVTNQNEESSGIEWELSADGGGNWESVTPDTHHFFTSTGTSLKVKATLTEPTTPDAADDNIFPWIDCYAVLYNVLG